jgi:hypothetical protein
MATEDILKRIEERLTRLEAALAQQPGAAAGFTPPGGAVVDPPPWGGGGGGWVFHPRPIPSPVVDPAPWWYGGWGHRRWPTPIVDPGPFPTPVVDPGPWPGPIADPVPWGGGMVSPFRQAVATTFGRIGQIGDPPPLDVSRFTVSQLESALHTINAEKARLNSMETMIKQQLDKAKEQG